MDLMLKDRVAVITGPVKGMGAGKQYDESSNRRSGQLNQLQRRAISSIAPARQAVAKTHDDLGKVRGKLANQSFVANAPPDSSRKSTPASPSSSSAPPSSINKSPASPS